MFLWLPITSLLFFTFLSTNTPELVTTAMGSSSFRLRNETDLQALLAIKDLIPGDPLRVFSSWNSSIHFCNWYGVKCSRRHQQRVTVLDLSSLGLVGSLSPRIGNLTFLRTIDLGNNSFHGTIPQEIGRLFRLQNLRLLNNSFEGEFPTNLTHCSDIRVINVYKNNLGGKIPTEVGLLSSLSYLLLAENNFTGPIPSSIGNLSALCRLYLADNNLEGSIPLELGQLLKLEHFQLSYCNLSGLVPTSLYNISSITFFSIAGNLLHGSLPPDLGLTLPKLELFYVGANQFFGSFPSSMANGSRLVEIDIGSNSFTGRLPLNLGSLYNLQVLSFYSNSFGSNETSELMNFFVSISNCSNLWLLNLAYNRLRGQLPHSIANLSTNINRLYLDKNYFTGSIPLGIGDLVNLQILGLSENMLTGIPDSISKLSKLQGLYFDTNNITTPIPSSIGNLTQLRVLTLQENVLEGSIPVSLGNCTHLQQIDLEHNHLTGPIPEQIFGLFSLSVGYLNDNYLSGPLPLQVGNLINLGTLVVSENKLSGEIPSTLGSCQMLEFLYMDGNLFEGSIPASFEQLKGIQVLDLSRNNVSGQIPRFLGKLTSIQYLNLSHNMFDGEVPNEGVFKNVSAFSVVGNDKLCGGITTLQLPACPVQILEKKKKSFNHRVIIPLITTLVIVLLLLFFLAFIYRIKKPKQRTPLTSPMQNHYPKLSYSELVQATNGFSSANLIGEGRYSSVFKGILNSDEQIVAVKVLNLQQRGANKGFVAECEALRTSRHRNLVKVITTCSSIDSKGNDFKALVLEFMPNGSLESWLHPSLFEQDNSKNLNLVQRLNIAIDVASALDYLHHHCGTVIIHCDLKPSNILLDDDLCAHVGDFGLAKILSATTIVSDHQQSSSIGIKGTVGFVAPEYGMGVEISTEGDMYSYGVLLMEMFTGKRPTNDIFIDNSSLHNFVKMSLPDRVMDIVDPQILSEKEQDPFRRRQRSTTNISKVQVCLVSILQIGVSCSAELPSERLNAKDVLMELHKIRNVFLGLRGEGRRDGANSDS